MEAKIAVAKIGKYATSESGDTLEMVERPSGGISVVLSDGQRSGKPAKAISNVVTRKAISLLADGVRDGAAARAASDYLYTYRGGKVIATLNILSIDTQTQTMVITRNNPAPVVLITEGRIQLLDDPVQPVGSRRGIRPSICEFRLIPNLYTVIFTDGLSHAGKRAGQPLSVTDMVKTFLNQKISQPQEWADRLLARALELERNRPTDDITVVVGAVHKHQGDDVRRLWARMRL